MRKRTLGRESKFLIVSPFTIPGERIDGMDGILSETIKEREF
jgi:hypothetical protein